MNKYFLKDMSPYRPLQAICSNCEVETVFSGYLRIRLDTHAVHHHQYQCQSCGTLTYGSEPISDSYFDDNLVEHELVRMALDQPCGCGGQFRRDRNIFCPSCKHRHDPEHNCRNDYDVFVEL